MDKELKKNVQIVFQDSKDSAPFLTKKNYNQAMSIQILLWS